MFLLLRDARAAGLLHDRRPGFFAGQGIADLWSLHRLRLSHPDLWRNDRRSLAGAPPRVADRRRDDGAWRSEEHTSELQSLMRTSYAVFCLKKKTIVRCTRQNSSH